jgi:hypothetical protein
MEVCGQIHVVQNRNQCQARVNTACMKLPCDVSIGAPGGVARQPPPLTKAKFKNTGFVDTIISKDLRDLPFILDQPLK